MVQYYSQLPRPARFRFQEADLGERFPLQAELREGNLPNQKAIIVDTTHPPGGSFLVLPQESYERKALRGDAECHAPACQAALP